MLDLGRLRILRELRRRGTAGAVAEALGYSPSAVSQQLAQLQREVGVPLVERAGRRLRLTAAGEALAGHADALLDGARRAEEDARAASGRVTGRVEVVGFQTAILHLLAPALPRLAAAYPDLVVEIHDDEYVRVLQALVQQEVDLVLSCEYSHVRAPAHPELAEEVLFTEPMRLLLPERHPLALAAGPVRLADLGGATWATGHLGTGHADVVASACAELGGFRPDVRQRSNDLLVIFAMVRAGSAAIVPELAMEQEPPGVAVRPIAEADVRRRMVLRWRTGADARPPVRAVLDEVRARAAALAAERPALARE
ncbi:LysR family transcriptional regulator [Actinomadura parmotrematis]|uniref:LysR family transcriptional regulator n=1 Tax=Actinomadura parmotrematis TaxID=2864039 RepID=A0ABS7FYV4_9ACTN|nr:LysR family transcriptional regulator [Actinomadura parmotrematis]MBW8484613.1 LysR family transcriptional regulator [Actinomadura parmotrematis]